MKVAVVGTGYVGLVTGVCLSAKGHQVTCIDINPEKIKMLQSGVSPIYEPGLEDLIQDNMKMNRLSFSSCYTLGVPDAEVIILAVGTPQLPDGHADLSYMKEAARQVAIHVEGNAIIAIKSTVPVGTNEEVFKIIRNNLTQYLGVEIVSNPEFLREGSAIDDTLKGDRIVIGADSERAFAVMAQLYEDFDTPIMRTDIRSAELIKYASNAFLATKISFINEISNLAEKLGANINDIAVGMGYDKRIGNKFLQAGIGYGGSCFPKDTNALVQIAGNVRHDFKLLKSVIEVNSHQQNLLIQKVKERFQDLTGLRVALLGISFKPNTDDIRYAASLVIANGLTDEGAEVVAYDPVAIRNAKSVLPNIKYADSIDECVTGADVALIVTEWAQIVDYDYARASRLMRQPVIFDGRNCLGLERVKEAGVEYHSIGRPSIAPEPITY